MMTAIEETKSILRRIIYVTTFCFAIYGITSIGILVDKSRKRTSVSLSTALILLAILLAFLVIFTVIICLWRRNNQNNKSRQRGRDEEELYRTSPGGHRYIRTDFELRAIKRKENDERRQKDRRRSIWDRIHHAGDRISGRQISYPWDAKDERGDQIRGPGPLDAYSVRKPPAPFVERQEPLFGHSNGTGLFGDRPAHGAGLNPNHSLSSPASPRSPSPVRRTDENSRYSERVYNRPENSVYTPEKFEEWARRQRHQDAEGRQHDKGAQTRQVPKKNHVAAPSHAHREERSSPSNHAQGEKKSRIDERAEQEKNGEGRGCEVLEGKMAVLNTPPKQHVIPRKEVGTPPKIDAGILGAKLHDDNGAALDRKSGVTIGYGGERIIISPGRLPSKLVGHGLIAVPAQNHHTMHAQGQELRRSLSGHERWRHQSGYYASRKDGILSMVSEEKSEGSRNSDGSKKSWNHMTADEVQQERSRRKQEKQKKKGKGVYEAYSKKGQVARPRPLVVRNRTPTPPLATMKGSPKSPMAKIKESSMGAAENQSATMDLDRSPSGVYRKTQQEQDRLEEERWLHRASSFHSDNQKTQTQTQQQGGRQLSKAYQHLSALPSGLHIAPKQPALKKTKLSKQELGIGTTTREEIKLDVEILQEMQAATISKHNPSTKDTFKAYTTQMTSKPAIYQPPTVNEHRKYEKDWQRQKRIKEWNDRNEAEKACQELVAALQQVPQLKELREPWLHEPSFPATPAPNSFADWENRYRRNARQRGVSGFTSASISTNHTVFPSYEEMEQERKEEAAKEERRKFSQFMADSEYLRSSEIERIADSVLPMDAEELERINRMAGEKLEDEKRRTAAALDDFEKQTAAIAKPITTRDSLPSLRNLAEAKLAQENQEWARKNHEAASKLSVRSLHTTERGTTSSSFQGQAQSSAPKGGQVKASIPRLVTATKNAASAVKATPNGTTNATPGRFGYHAAIKGTPEARKKAAKAQGQGSASKKVNGMGPV